MTWLLKDSTHNGREPFAVTPLLSFFFVPILRAFEIFHS